MRVPNPLSGGLVRNPLPDNLFIINIMQQEWFPTSGVVPGYVYRKGESISFVIAGALGGPLAVVEERTRKLSGGGKDDVRLRNTCSILFDVFQIKKYLCYGI